MEDYFIRATAADGAIRAFCATTQNTVETARTIHQLSPVATAALGRLLTAAAMVGGMAKGEQDLLTLQIKGDGPLGGLLATADCKGAVKGYVYYPSVELPEKSPGKLNVGGAVGKGQFTVLKDIGLKEPYVGSCELVSGEIAEDLAQYFAVSEQTPSAVSLGVLVDVDYTVKEAGGFILQLMPEAPEETAKLLEARVNALPHITELLKTGITPEKILQDILGDFGLTVYEKTPIQFYCNCSRERVERVLISLGKKELEKILQEDKEATLHCHFCNKKYYFPEATLRALLQEL